MWPTALPPCTSSMIRGEWYFHLSEPMPFFPDCTRINGSSATLHIELAHSLTDGHFAALLGDQNGGLGDTSVGSWTTTGDESSMEVIVGNHVLFATLAAPKCNESSVGVWRDANAEQWGCFRGVRRHGGGLFCAEGTECHGAASVQVGVVRMHPHGSPAASHEVAHRVRLGSHELPESVLVPALLDLPPSPPPPSLNASRLAAEINAAGLPWRASASYPRLAALESLLGQGASATPPWPPAAATEPLAAPRTEGSSNNRWPTVLDWRTHRGGGWLSPAVDLFDALPATAGCAAASHVAAVLASVEARVRIGTNCSQDERFGLSLEAALGCSPYAFGCVDKPSAYLVGKIGIEIGFERRSCVPGPSAAAMVRGAEHGRRYLATPAEPTVLGTALSAEAVEAPNATRVTSAHAMGCTSLPRCPSPLRRRARAVRWVGGYYGGATERTLLEELQHGPIAVGLFLEPEFALYRAGIFRALERDTWQRNLGRTLPAYDRRRCHSGCKPPESLEWQATNYGALLVGYGVDEAEGEPYWIVQLPWGADWGEAGYARVLRGEAAVEAAALVVDPMI